MSETVWLKEVLADANAAAQKWPTWAKESAHQATQESVTEQNSSSTPTKPKISAKDDLKLI
jgi:hypothetical protein